MGVSSSNDAPAPALTRPATALPDLVPVAAPDRRRIAGLFSALVSITLLAVVFFHFGAHGLDELAVLAPRTWQFWVAFAAYYLTMPFSELIIYKRLWNLPFSGLAALMRKQVSNELLLGYLGEAQFYAWARNRLTMEAAPFGAVKDVTILSALMGNVVTILLLAVTWPLVRAGGMFASLHTAFVSLSVVLVTSFAILLFRRSLFSLPARELRFIAAVHTVRIFTMLGFAAAMWHAELPNVAIALWLVLATLRMLVSRLPLVPNKDAVFAAVGVMVLGRDLPVSDVLTMMAMLMVFAHICVGALFGLGDLVGRARARL